MGALLSRAYLMLLDGEIDEIAWKSHDPVTIYFYKNELRKLRAAAAAI